MIASINLDLDTSRKNRKVFPVVYKITFKRKTKKILTGYYIPLKFWDRKKREIKKKCPGIEFPVAVNIELKGNINKYQQIIFTIPEKELQNYSIQALADYITNKNRNCKGITDFTLNLIKSFFDAGRYGNAEVYRISLKFLQNRFHKKNILFEDITLKWLMDTELKYTGSMNGLSVYLRTIRAIYNRAIKLGITDCYPFKNYTIRSEKTKKRFLTKQEINKVLSYKPENRQEELALDYFVFAFLCMGMNFADMAMLQYDVLNDNRIEYKRAKTGKLYSVSLNDTAIAIINKYKDKSFENYIFPIIINNIKIYQKNYIRNARNTTNKHLNIIAKKLKLNSLTMYVGRHTWATLALRANIPVPVISQSLGHSSIKTTEIYLADFDFDIVDGANLAVLESLKE